MSDRIPLFEAYDVTTGGYTYGRFGPMQNSRKFVKTSGSSTTVVDAVSSTNALDEVSVGTQINVNRDGTVDTRYCTAKASGASITIDTAANWSRDADGTGYPYQFRQFLSGTTASDGWFGVRQFEDKTIQLIVTTINATSITFTVEGRIKGAQQTATTLYTSAAYTAAGSEMFQVPELADEVRVGVKLAGDAGVQSVSAYFNGRLAQRG